MEPIIHLLAFLLVLTTGYLMLALLAAGLERLPLMAGGGQRAGARIGPAAPRLSRRSRRRRRPRRRLAPASGGGPH